MSGLVAKCNYVSSNQELITPPSLRTKTTWKSPASIESLITLGLMSPKSNFKCHLTTLARFSIWHFFIFFLLGLFLNCITDKFYSGLHLNVSPNDCSIFTSILIHDLLVDRTTVKAETERFITYSSGAFTWQKNILWISSRELFQIKSKI